MSIEIRYLGHSGFIIKAHNDYIMIDPFITGNPKAYKDFDSLDVKDILVTHGHMDHLGDSLKIAHKHNSIISAVYELANYCAKKGVKTQGVNAGGKITFDWGSTYWFQAAHSSSTPEGEYAGIAASILLNIVGIKIFHAGDTALHYDLKMIGELYTPDIALLPIGGHFTMGIDEAVKAAEWLGCKQVIPMHYDTFPQISINVEEFKQKLELNTQAKCVILKSGELYTI